MRSSKSRSRSKSNRNRSVGNVVNRVFDSSGPEGKVRGTPQQIIDKYNQLARDAQLSNDGVATENFQQHAEHYTRLLSDALREAEARREQHEAQQQAQRERSAQQRSNPAPRDDARTQQNAQQQPSATSPLPPDSPQPDIAAPAVSPKAEAPAEGGAGTQVIDLSAEGESGLVDTPENAPKPKTSSSRSRKAPAKPATKSA